MLTNREILAKFEAHREAASAPTSPDLFAPDARRHRCEAGQWVTVIDTRDRHFGCVGRVDYRNASRVVVVFPLPEGNETFVFSDDQLQLSPTLNQALNGTTAPASPQPADAFDAALTKAIESAKATRAEWIADANEMLGLLTMASKDSDVNHVLTLTLIGKLREHINRA